MRIALIAALSTNRVIGRDNQMPWHMPNDLKYFKRVTMAKPVLMGRKTFESIGRPLPGRTNIVVTRQKDWQNSGVRVARSVTEALELASLSLIAGNEEVIVIGGAQIYRETLPLAQRLYLTELHAHIDGDAQFPAICENEWIETGREDHQADPANPYNHSFVVLDRVTSLNGGNHR